MFRCTRSLVILALGTTFCLGCHHAGYLGSRCDVSYQQTGSSFTAPSPQGIPPSGGFTAPPSPPAEPQQLMPPQEPKSIPPKDEFLPPVKGPIQPPAGAVPMSSTQGDFGPAPPLRSTAR